MVKRRRRQWRSIHAESGLQWTFGTSPNLNVKRTLKPANNRRVETLTSPCYNSQRAPQRNIVAARNGPFNNYIPAKPPLGHSHNAIERYSKLTESFTRRLSVSPPLRDIYFINSLPNLGTFLERAMRTRNHRLHLYFRKEREVLDMFKIGCYCSGIFNSSAFELW